MAGSTTQHDTSGVEKHWGDPNRSQPREDTSRGEKIAGITWLTIGAVLSFILELVYLGSHLTIGGRSYPFPITVLIAFGFNYVLSKTARLWTHKFVWVSLPLVVWTLLYIVALLWPVFPSTGGTTWMAPGLSGMLFLLLGVAGGAWPLMAGAVESSATPPPANRKGR